MVHDLRKRVLSYNGAQRDQHIYGHEKLFKYETCLENLKKKHIKII